VAAPLVRRRKAPGRPQHVYTLTEDASKHFPKRYDHLASMILTELRSILPADELESMMERIGARLAEQAALPDGEDLETNLDSIVGYLNERGYLASCERDGDAFKLHVANCPFEQVALLHSEVCTVDMTMLTRLLGQSPERVTWASQTDRQCTYIIRPPAD
jgi:predicted ArsR family transcriptional regulator